MAFGYPQDFPVSADPVLYTRYHMPPSPQSKILTCEVTGEWSDELPACIATECEGPKPPDVEGAYRDTDVIKSGTAVNYTCLDDLVFINGDKYRIATCDIVTLQWLNVPTDCVDEAVIIKSGHTYPPEEAKSGPAYGTIGLTLIGTLIVVILVLDLGTLSRFIPCGKSSSTADNLVELESQGQTEVKRKPKTKIKKQKTERQTSGRKSSAPPDSKSQNTSQEKEEENSDSETDEDEW
ncbi:hypothetical protein EB796_005581 [Bugula neritina]|uniref:Uncharacterized protein n=1 Tax=Bugula neritina TaxID=10212 RepID=A0A7J7KD31_BUGNE|nr:hypothetical protein EB796_005581 [Bugula neritina]